MKRLFLLVVLAAVAAGGIYYGLQRAQPSYTEVAALLPRGTIALAHFPDFKRTRDEWHQSDIYKLYQEPAVQEFLKPLNVQQRDASAETLDEIERVDPKNAFVAITSVEGNNPHFLAGFRFHGSQSDAETMISKWRSHLVRDPSAHETVDYETHKIDIVGAAPNQIASVYDGRWFFASNDLAELKAILDRVDGRAKNPPDTLESDEIFRAAMGHMLPSYALLLYLQPKGLSGRLSQVNGAIGANVSADQRALLEQMQTVCAAAKFDRGKIRDVLFVGMPKMPEDRELTRSSLKLGTADTVLYIVAVLNPDRLAGISLTGAALPLGSWFQKVFEVAARTGVTAEEWKAAFDPEAGALAEWSQTAHLPSIIAALPVKDLKRAQRIVDALTKAIDEDLPWRKAEKNGVAYYYAQSPVALFAITPTIAISNQQLVVGLDSVSVEAAMARSEPNAQAAKSSATLANSQTYKTAAHAVPAPTNGFVYLDTKLLYTRLDAALRPMLLVSTAFMPAISDYVDATKLPPSESVTRHLTPMVSTQFYDKDGYVTESTGPVTLDIGLGLPALGWALSHHQQN